MMSFVTPTGEQANQVLFGNRYRLLHALGSGGMGSVYRAHDLLTGEQVAIKRVHSVGQAGVSTPALRLALTREFQALAGLRHPNIVNVRDYGFDEAQQPFFVMDILAQPQTIVNAGQWLDNDGKVTLLLQLLAALVYIHRRTVIHRDLKPGNVLIVGNDLKVLDFGLAGMADQQLATAGTLAYLAPEILLGKAASVASDLYAVGVMAFEMLAGWHPFAESAIPLAQAILHSSPDFSFVEITPQLRQIIERLLAKDPDLRYHDAQAVISDLCAACGRAIPPESTTTRDSFLQTAPLMGRTDELKTLTTALQATCEGQGGGWLISGESGIGKSRLLQELQTHALVLGVTVLRGQAQRHNAASFQLWRELLRALVLVAQPTEAEAAILHAIVPDIGALLQTPIAEPPPLDPKTAQSRLLFTLVNLIQRAAAVRPLLLLLEDLHWGDANSLELLQRMALPVQEQPQPILIVASFRSEESSYLATQLPTLRLLKLTRLDETSVGRLSQAMLGAPGGDVRFVQFLQKESEGNTFFMIEVMRALAEQAGRLDQIAQMVLPEKVFAGGIQQIVLQRLQRVPQSYQLPLQLAAVGGRQVDINLLRSLAPSLEIEDWLMHCANAAILELPGGALRWQFTHDKMRDGILSGLSAHEEQSLHRQLGAAIEDCYVDALALHFDELVYHFGRAQETGKERQYALLAGEQAVTQFDNQRALQFLDRYLQLCNDEEYAARCTAILLREKVYHVLGQRDLQAQDLAMLDVLIDALQVDAMRAELLLRKANYALVRSNYADALLWASQAIKLAQSNGEPAIETRAHLCLGSIYWQQSKYIEAREHMFHALEQSRVIQSAPLEAQALNDLGTICRHEGKYQEAITEYKQALHLHQATGDAFGEARALLNLGVIYEQQGNYQDAQSLYERSLELRQKLGDRRGVGRTLNNLGVIADSQGNFVKAIGIYEKALAIYQEIDDRWGQGYVLNNLAFNYRSLGDFATAHRYGEQAIQIRNEIGDVEGESETQAFCSLIILDLGENERARTLALQSLQLAREQCGKPQLGYSLTCYGRVMESLAEWSEAQRAFAEAVAIRRELGEQNRVIESLAGLVRVALHDGDSGQALSQCEEILHHLAEHSLDGTEEPFLTYLTCYQTLIATYDERAVPFLQTAQQKLQQRADLIDNKQLQDSFLRNVAANLALAKL